MIFRPIFWLLGQGQPDWPPRLLARKTSYGLFWPIKKRRREALCFERANTLDTVDVRPAGGAHGVGDSVPPANIFSTAPERGSSVWMVPVRSC